MFGGPQIIYRYIKNGRIMNILFEETKSSIHFSVCSFSMGFSVLKTEYFPWTLGIISKHLKLTPDQRHRTGVKGVCSKCLDDIKNSSHLRHFYTLKNPIGRLFSRPLRSWIPGCCGLKVPRKRDYLEDDHPRTWRPSKWLVINPPFIMQWNGWKFPTSRSLRDFFWKKGWRNHYSQVLDSLGGLVVIYYGGN